MHRRFLFGLVVFFLIVSSINNEFLTDFVESMFYIVRWEIIGKWVISGK